MPRISAFAKSKHEALGPAAETGRNEGILEQIVLPMIDQPTNFIPTNRGITALRFPVDGDYIGDRPIDPAVLL